MAGQQARPGVSGHDIILGNRWEIQSLVRGEQFTTYRKYKLFKTMNVGGQQHALFFLFKICLNINDLSMEKLFPIGNK